MRPLSGERRREIKSEYDPMGDSTPLSESHIGVTVRELLESERYWREAIRKVPQFVPRGDQRHMAKCAFCDISINLYDRELPKHKADCAWVLAQ